MWSLWTWFNFSLTIYEFCTLNSTKHYQDFTLSHPKHLLTLFLRFYTINSALHQWFAINHIHTFWLSFNMLSLCLWGHWIRVNKISSRNTQLCNIGVYVRWGTLWEFFKIYYSFHSSKGMLHFFFFNFIIWFSEVVLRQ